MSTPPLELGALTVHDVVLSMKPPGGSWSTVAPASDPAGTIAVDTATISWGSPSPRDHAEPGSIRFALLVNGTHLDEELLTYDTEFTIGATITRFGFWQGDLLNDPRYDNKPIIPLARGWITSWKKGKPRPDGRLVYQIHAIDVLGRAAATKLAASPWPASHTDAQRRDAINAASPSGPLLAPTALPTSEALDVDNATALDIIQRHAPAIGSRVTEQPAGINYIAPSNRTPQYENNELYFTVYSTAALALPASCVEDSGREMDRGSVISDVAVNAYWGNETERRTITFRDPTVAYSSSRYSSDSDTRLIAVGGASSEPAVRTWAQALIRESKTPAIRLPRAQVLVHKPQFSNVGNVGLNMFRLGLRDNILVRIDNGPADLEPLQYVTGGTLTINRRRLRLSVEMAPARLYGLRPLRFSDLPTGATTRPRYAQTWRPNIIGTATKTRWRDTSLVNFAPWPQAIF